MEIDKTKCMCLIKDLSRQCGNPRSNHAKDDRSFCSQHQNCPIERRLLPYKPFTSTSLIPRQLKKLSGPSIFAYYYIKEFNKAILFLGEIHGRNGLCDPSVTGMCDFYGVSKWLKQIIPQSNHCIDMLVEDTYRTYPSREKQTRTQSTEYGSSLGMITDTFEECHGNVRQCFGGKLRYHYADIRSTDTDMDPYVPEPHKSLSCMMDSLYYAVKRGIPLGELYITQVYDQKLYKRLLQYAIGIDTSIEGRDIYEDYYTNLLQIKTQLPEKIIGWRKYHEHIILLINKQVAKLHPLIDRYKFMDMLCDICILLSSKDKSYIGLAVIQQDAYLLCRLFSIFPDKKSHETDSIPYMCRQSPTINHAIVYTGATHTMVYINLLNNFFKIKPKYYKNITQSRKSQCIELDEPFDFYEDISP